MWKRRAWKWTMFNSKYRKSKKLNYILISVCLVYLILVFKTIVVNLRSTEMKYNGNMEMQQSCHKQESETVPWLRNAFAEVLETVFRFFGMYKEMNLQELQNTYPAILGESELEELLRSGHHHSNPHLYPFPYHAILAPNKTCEIPSLKRDSILFIIKSSASNINRRIAIRRTWGNENIFPFIKTLFFVGMKDDDLEQIIEEAKQFDDIVQYNFMDNYFNNTLKMISAFQWTVKSCPSFRFVVMADDDYLIMTDRLQDLLKSVSFQSTKYLYMGEVCENRRPHRYYLHKWYISPEHYPYNKYPPFVTAGTVIMSMDFINDSVKIFPFTKPLPFDDCYLSIVASKLNVHPTHSPFITMKKTRVEDSLFKHIISTHGYNCPDELVNVWTHHYYK